MYDFGVWGVYGTIFIVDFKKNPARKLRITILLHFGLIAFRFHFGTTRKSLMFMVFGFLDVSMTPTTNYFFGRDTK